MAKRQNEDLSKRLPVTTSHGKPVEKSEGPSANPRLRKRG